MNLQNNVLGIQSQKFKSSCSMYASVYIRCWKGENKSIKAEHRLAVAYPGGDVIDSTETQWNFLDLWIFYKMIATVVTKFIYLPNLIKIHRETGVSYLHNSYINKIE